MSSFDHLYLKQFGVTRDELHRVRAANAEHPELEPGEMFYHNGDQAFFDSWKHYNSRRPGRVAYDAEGNVIPGLFPIFVKEAELQERATRLLNTPRASPT